MKFMQLILWPGGAYTYATHADKAKIMIPYSDEIINHDYIGSLGCIPNEPKRWKRDPGNNWRGPIRYCFRGAALYTILL